MNPETAAFIAIGSNIEPFQNIPACLAKLAGIRDSHLTAKSDYYLTRPWGIDNQAIFVNLVVGLTTHLEPWGLLRETQAIESRLERVKTIRNGPRTIDLDILLFGQARIKSRDLTIPHPGLLERDFMLEPLIEIAADSIHPGYDLPVRQLTGHLRYRQIIERLEDRG